MVMQVELCLWTAGMQPAIPPDLLPASQISPDPSSMKAPRNLRGTRQWQPRQMSKTGPRLLWAFQRSGNLLGLRLKNPQSPFSLFYPRSAPKRPKRKPRRSEGCPRRNPRFPGRSPRRGTWNLSWPRLRRRDPWSRKYRQPPRAPCQMRPFLKLQRPLR